MTGHQYHRPGGDTGGRSADRAPAGAPAARRAPCRTATPRPSRLRRAASALLIALTGAATLTGCADRDLFLGGAPPAPEEAIRILPGDGARGVRANGRLEVRVPEGRLERVEVNRAGGSGRQPVAGRISRDGTIWRPVTDSLELASRYTVDAVAVDGAGRRTTRHTTFNTFAPPHRLIGFYSPESGATVGTGLIFSLVFNRPVLDRAAVERAVTVSARPAVEVAPHWFGHRRLDFRPRERWRPGTRLTVQLRLREVRTGPGAYGIQHKTLHYQVGRDQVSTVDAARHTLTVRRDGKVVATLPVTAGNAENPTYNGTMVILERHAVTRMDGDTVGFGAEYDIPDVPHAMRLTRSGTFLHGNYWARREVFGGLNTSHGCVGLRDVRGGGPDTPAGWLYRNSIVGDTVEVRNSPDRTVAPDNGLGGWNMPWAAWRAGSAPH
ncbi:L,D-transpeptidase [Streptomyces noursei]|uniref:L,D-transpeptidase n=1 Tax=Streptomyces noursei TaxID=1971 RepID=UPI00196240C5|nr:Ig-like domain-containing protein [Streptomyces noursei]QRX94364.1 L,D-transpeptidase family protein [Streptomyces noursei]